MRLEPETQPFGAIVVAKPKTELRDAVGRRSCSGWRSRSSVGIVVAGAARRGTCRGGSPAPCSRSRDAADEIAAGNYAVACRRSRGGGEIGHLAERFDEMAAGSREAEERERQFLMSVSHELRTPLTAIRGHVDALRDGRRRGSRAARARSTSSPRRRDRLERLVGDVLDLAKLDAHRFTVLSEEVDMDRLVEQAYRRSARRRAGGRSTTSYDEVDGRR